MERNIKFITATDAAKRNETKKTSPHEKPDSIKSRQVCLVKYV